MRPFDPFDSLDSLDQSGNQQSSRNGEAVTRRSLFARMLTLAAALPLSSILVPRAAAAKIDASAGRGFYKIVTYATPPEHWREFLDACKVNGEASRKETGITSFEVLIAQDAPNTVIAVEAYRDEDASKAHQKTAHFLSFVQAVQRLGVKRSVVAATRYYPG
jgi:quinol monooxygenase YgiN